MVLQLFVWPQKLDVIVAEKQWQGLVHLQQGQILAYTKMAATAELDTGSLISWIGKLA
jgi:hypothetical protein